MIQSLTVSNFALIEKLHIDFSSGFSIITGETGAGKSILLGALGLVLGKRADLSSLKNKEEKCVIEATFTISHYNLQNFFETYNLDYDNSTILRREVLPSGKSRAFINDTPVNLNELQELSDFLIDIHSQHQTSALFENNFQFQIVDTIADNRDLLHDYAEHLKAYKSSQLQLQNLELELQNLLKDEDYTGFLLNELQQISLNTINQVEMEESYERLNNIEFIKECLTKAISIANDENYGLLHNLHELKVSLQKVVGFSADFQELFDRIDSVQIELKDVTNELTDKEAELVDDPENLHKLSEQLQLLYTLQKKHQVTTVDELLKIRSQLENKVHAVQDSEDKIKILKDDLNKIESYLNDKATMIHENRIGAIPIVTQNWEKILSQLGMPHVQFRIDLKPTVTFLHNGKEEIEFYFSANKGADFGLLKKVASGGEMSRIMLATKAILADYSSLPTIIFDEIDTGVSGEIANKMSEIMKSMSHTMQVIAITHLPQIAAKGDAHFKVFKNVKNEQTTTEIKALSTDDRIVEIAQMLSGTTITDSAINHAKTLLN